MKKLLATLFAAAVMAGFGAGVASAEQVCPAGDGNCATVNEGGYVLVLDGDASNQDPADGYISVDGDGNVCASDEGAAGEGDPTCLADQIPA